MPRAQIRKKRGDREQDRRAGELVRERASAEGELESSTFSNVFVAPGAIESLSVSGFGLLCPARRNDNWTSATSAFGLLIQIVV
ncbi:MAG TPA: hypothetical protein VGQ76_11540 [Thermoanaerobaculia bacterium]|jgi:hypothetical protein|nr:hypothetical protein [Thermoanaerobaculia bacterium]